MSYLYDIWSTDITNSAVVKLRNGSLSTTNIAVGSNPYGICVDLDGDTWVTNIKSDTVSRLSDGVRTDIQLAAGSRPYGICVDKNNIKWVTCNGIDKVISIINDKGDIGVELDVTGGPRGICVDTKNNLWVSRFGANKVSKITDGQVISEVEVGTNPYGICADKSDYIWVTNHGSDTVSKLVDGNNILTISVGKCPKGICVDKDNYKWIANGSSNNVSKISDTEWLLNIPVDLGPCGICVDKDNAVYVSSVVNSIITKIVDDEKYSEISMPGTPTNFGDASGMQAYLVVNPTTYNTVTKIAYDDLDDSLQEKIDLASGTSGPTGITASSIYYHNTSYATVEAALDKLLYVTPAITSFTNDVNTVELGQTVDTVTLNWATNKVPDSQFIDQGVGTISVGTTSKALTGLALTVSKTWNLSIADATTTVAKSTSISFLNKVYYGVSALTTLADSDILNLTGVFAATRNQSRTMDATGGKYLYFVVPSAFNCTINKFKVGGLYNSAFELVTRTFVNASGYSTSYDIFRSSIIQTGSSILVEIV